MADHKTARNTRCPRCDRLTAVRDVWRDPSGEVIAIAITCEHPDCQYRFNKERRR